MAEIALLKAVLVVVFYCLFFMSANNLLLINENMADGILMLACRSGLQLGCVICREPLLFDIDHRREDCTANAQVGAERSANAQVGAERA